MKDSSTGSPFLGASALRMPLLEEAAAGMTAWCEQLQDQYRPDRLEVCSSASHH